MPPNIPTINVSSGFEQPATVAAIGRACEEWGAFLLTGHDLPVNLQEQLFSVMAEFFTLPGAQKQQLSRTEQNFWGYNDRELTKNQVDAKEIFDIDANLDSAAASNSPVPWPTQLPQFRSVSLQWLRACEELGQQLLGAICLALDHSPATLRPFFLKDHSSFLRFNYYPAAERRQRTDDGTADTPCSETQLGIHPHSDAGALTILAHDGVPGLQIYKGDTWHTLDVDKDCLIINIGDMVQVWSNDRFSAPLHRVLASGAQPRYSAPYFYNPSYATICKPLVQDSTLSHYRPIAWGEFRAGRAAGDYADQGEEIQISWFRR